MPQQKVKKASREDLDGYGQLAERHWRAHRPKLVKFLEARGELYEHLVEAQRQAVNYIEQAQKEGVDPIVADEVATRTFILLPDVDDEEA